MVHKRLAIRKITAAEMVSLAAKVGVPIPIEQTEPWARFNGTFPGREHIGFFEIREAGEPAAVFMLTQYDYHGFVFLAMNHGPVWLVPVDPERERAAVRGLINWMRKVSPWAAFVRMHLSEPTDAARDPMQVMTYDSTVIMSLADNQDDLLRGFKKRARSRLRQAQRRHPLEVADVTPQATADFSPYHQILAETAQRQGFTPWPANVYQDLLSTLGPDHARIFAATQDGSLVAWAIFTAAGTEVTYYYAASSLEGRDTGAAVQILAAAAVQFGAAGYKTMDLMGVGSQDYPELDSLTAFKSGFATEITRVSPAYDIPLNGALFWSLEQLRTGKKRFDGLLTRLRNRNNREEQSV